jgi:SAM-dependent methyltransferase
MADDTALAAMFEYYERGAERGRLDAPAGQLEFARTRQIIVRHLPPPPATVADIGGGPGRYSLWLAALGYRVLHRDVVPLHVDQLRRQAAGKARIDSAVADARDPGLDPGSADAVLLLGPLYHLDHRADRRKALAAAARVVRPGGPVFAAAISRWAARLDGVLRNRLCQASPLAEPMLTGSERTGRLSPLSPGGFAGYTHRPGQLRAEITASGLRLTDLVSVEGPAFLLSDLGERLADDEDRRVVIETATALAQPHRTTISKRRKQASRSSVKCTERRLGARYVRRFAGRRGRVVLPVPQLVALHAGRAGTSSPRNWPTTRIMVEAAG